MNTDIVWGGLLVLGTVCATIQHYITKKSAESEIASLKTRLEFAKQETRIWKATAYRHADERNHAVRMAQYWRKQALNEHFGFEPEKAAPTPKSRGRPCTRSCGGKPRALSFPKLPDT